jgi:hypothetical protein
MIWLQPQSIEVKRGYGSLAYSRFIGFKFLSWPWIKYSAEAKNHPLQHSIAPTERGPAQDTSKMQITASGHIQTPEMSTKGGLVLFLKKGCREAPAKATKYIQPKLILLP